MRISSWSSVVCSSYLRGFRPTTFNGRLELSSFCVDGLDDSKRWVLLDEHSDKQPIPARAELSATAIDQAGLRQDPDWDPERHVNIVDWPSEEERQRTCRSEEHTSELQSLMRTSYAV